MTLLPEHMAGGDFSLFREAEPLPAVRMSSTWLRVTRVWDTVDLLSVFSEGRLTHVIGQLTPDNHSALRVEMGVLDGTNQEVFLEEVMMSHDQGFQEEVAMRVMVFSEA